MDNLKKAFVLMPFKEPYNSYYNAIYKPALEAASYAVTRADDLSSPRPIMMDIQQSIIEANLILCDMSERNPNVFYELGLAHAIGRPAILVARAEDDIPFDLRHVRVILFDYSFAGWEQKLRNSITTTAQKVNEGTYLWPPPLIVVEDTRSKLLKNQELETMVATQEADIKRIRAEAEAKQQEILQKTRYQDLELERARAELKYRQEMMIRAMDAIGQALASSTYPMDTRAVDIIKELVQELRPQALVGKNKQSIEKLEKTIDTLDATLLDASKNEDSKGQNLPPSPP